MVLGNVKVGDNSFVGANAVVLKDFDEEGVRLIGTPARKIE
jgi:serine acetyltransferase